MDKNSNWIVTDKIIYDTAIKCEACRANKPAKYEVILYSDNSPSSVTLNLGSECCRKGEMYHKFYHFELHMYNQIKQVVTEMMSKLHLQDKNTIHDLLIETEFIKKVLLYYIISLLVINLH